MALKTPGPSRRCHRPLVDWTQSGPVLKTQIAAPRRRNAPAASPPDWKMALAIEIRLMKMNTFFIILLLSALWCLIPTAEAWVDLNRITPLADNYLSFAVQNLNERARFVYKAVSVTHAHKTMASVTEYVDIQFDVKETSCTSQDIWKDDFELNKCEHKSNGVSDYAIYVRHCR
ncbi:hypothetical protein NDU88_003882 [Pleurodeles waltl]|uniref:Cystatin domain-containing protein n=1 Tax=Pleurodeles waltl TaxID=8319 RepID=A0AAV7M4N6_PLEWA|nr:hypothetical protein NDU88_003882 [Pleurodeles waltl]